MTQEDKYIKEHNLDEIDSFLLKEFGIIAGCCSAQKALEYSTARKVAEKLLKQPASKDLEEEVDEYILDNFDDAEGRVYVLQCARHFASWQKQQTINKACEWLLNNIRYYSTNALGAEYLCNDFRKAMEE